MFEVRLPEVAALGGLDEAGLVDAMRDAAADGVGRHRILLCVRVIHEDLCLGQRVSV
jgi:hypothetical protein